MNNTKHTPGLWKVVTSYEPTGIDFIIGSSDEPFIARVQDWNYVDENDGRYHAEANAKLIAAAPELLENLVRLLDRINENDLWNMFPSACERAEKAVKNATE